MNTISVDNDSDKLLEIEEKLTNNLVQAKVQYQSFIKWDHYSSLKKLVLHIACLLKFKQLWLIQKRKLLTIVIPHKITVKDIEQAEFEIFKEAQLECFPDEFRTLKKDMSLSKRSKLLPLNPIVVDNLIRVGGRIGQSHLPFEQKRQILLTKEHFLSTLLVLDKHERNYHIGREQTLSLLRESVWIIKGEALVRKVIQNCSFCKQRRVTPQSPIMSNLPEARLAINQPPFTNTVIGYFGPLTFKQGRRTRSTDETSKRYGAIFTCLSTLFIGEDIQRRFFGTMEPRCLKRTSQITEELRSRQNRSGINPQKT